VPNRSHSRGILGACLLALAGTHAAAETYVVFDIPNLRPRNQVFDVTGINAGGSVTGTYLVSGITQSFVRAADGTTTLITNPGCTTEAAGITTDGRVVVNGWCTSGIVIRTPDGTVTPVIIPGADNATATAINDNGDIVGTSYSATTGHAGFRLTGTGILTTVPDAYLFAINALGDAAGYYAPPPAGPQQALILSRDGSRTLFDVPEVDGGTPRRLSYPALTGINDSGTATGYSSSFRCIGNGSCAEHDSRSVVRSADGAMTVFRVNAPRENYTHARAINAAGWVVGETYGSTTRNRPPQGFLRDPSGTLSTFTVPAMSSTYPTAINDGGMIAGYCEDRQGRHGFIRMP
jgi:uncharacterized membrane protein